MNYNYLTFFHFRRSIRAIGNVVTLVNTGVPKVRTNELSELKRTKDNLGSHRRRRRSKRTK